VSDPIWPEATTHGVRRPAMHGRPKGWLGLGLAARSDGEAAHGAGTVRVHRSRSPCTARACDGAVACSLTAQWWLASGKVLPVSSRGPQGGRRTRRSGAELTQVMRAAWRRRRSMVARQLRWPMVMEARPCSVGTEEGR
jgi:hypothetical protein